jgi:hypothetical protein
MALKVCKRKVKPSKRLAAKSAKANRVSALQCWKRYLPARSGADILMSFRVRKRKVKPSKRLALNLPKQIGFTPFNAGRDIFQREAVRTYSWHLRFVRGR